MGGGNAPSTPFTGKMCGLSPRGRGKLFISDRILARHRSIPAWAGETRPILSDSRKVAVYPRVGGGNTPEGISAGSARGLSPRGRGKRCLYSPQCPHVRSIPAWAGETEARMARMRTGGVYPRVGGGNPHHIDMSAYRRGLSPRGRGKPDIAQKYTSGARSIPAWAGETR